MTNSMIMGIILYVVNAYKNLCKAKIFNRFLPFTPIRRFPHPPFRIFILLFVSYLLLGFSWPWVDPFAEKVLEGNQLYAEGRYEEAYNRYTEALKLSPSPLVLFNMAATQYQKGYYAEAIKGFDNVLSMKDPLLRAKGYYNLGNSLFKARLFDRAIIAYKEALKADPNDRDAKYNLELAIRAMKTQIEEREAYRGEFPGETPREHIDRAGVDVEALTDLEGEGRRMEEGSVDYKEEEMAGRFGIFDRPGARFETPPDIPEAEALRILNGLREKEFEDFKALLLRKARKEPPLPEYLEGVRELQRITGSLKGD